MLKEAFEYLVNRGREANRFKVETSYGSASFFDLHTGDLINRDLPRLPDVGKFSSLESIRAIQESGSLLSSGMVWVSEKKIVFADCGDGHRSRFTMDLRLNPSLNILKALRNQKQKNLIAVLRTEFSGSASHITPEDFELSIRSLKFESEQKSESTIQKGDESMSRSVKATVSGASVIPDEIIVTVNVYPDLVFDKNTQDIRCAVYVEPTEGLISVIPIAGEAEKAVLNSLTSLAEKIQGDNPDLTVILGEIQTGS